MENFPASLPSFSSSYSSDPGFNRADRMEGRRGKKDGSPKTMGEEERRAKKGVFLNNILRIFLFSLAWETEQWHRLEHGQASPPLFLLRILFSLVFSLSSLLRRRREKVRKLRRVMMTLMSGRRRKKGGREWGIALWAQKRRRKTFGGERKKSHFLRYVTPSQRKKGKQLLGVVPHPLSLNWGAKTKKVSISFPAPLSSFMGCRQY